MIPISTLCLWVAVRVAVVWVIYYSGLVRNLAECSRFCPGLLFSELLFKVSQHDQQKNERRSSHSNRKAEIEKSKNENSTQESKLLLISPFIRSLTRSSHLDVGGVSGGGCSGIHGRRSGSSSAAVVGLVPATTNNQQSTCSSFISCYYQ